MKSDLIENLIAHGAEYQSGCIKAYDRMQLELVVENFYSWVLSGAAGDAASFSLKPEEWWLERLQEASDQELEGNFRDSLRISAESVRELAAAGLDMLPYLNIFPDLTWDMDLLANDIGHMVQECFDFREQFSPERFRLFKPLPILEPVVDELEAPEVMMTPLDYVYWWAAWYFCRKKRRLSQQWWDERSRWMGRAGITTSLARIKEEICGKSADGTYIYGIDESFYGDGRAFPYPEYPVDLAIRYANLFTK